MKIDNVKVFGIEESIIASGLPMVEEYNAEQFSLDSGSLMLHLYGCKPSNCKEIQDEFQKTPDLHNYIDLDKRDKHLKRVKTLASCAGGESHDCFLVGCIVQCNVTAPRYWWPEAQRYHFIDIISSSSTMHRLKKFLAKAIEYKKKGDSQTLAKLIHEHFSKDTWSVIIDDFLTMAENRMKQSDVGIEELKANLPDGWLQTARITTNYRQLRTIVRQRSKHRLQEWRDFCAWVATLPMANDLIFGGIMAGDNDK